MGFRVKRLWLARRNHWPELFIVRYRADGGGRNAPKRLMTIVAYGVLTPRGARRSREDFRRRCNRRRPRRRSTPQTPGPHRLGTLRPLPCRGLCRQKTEDEGDRGWSHQAPYQTSAGDEATVIGTPERRALDDAPDCRGQNQDRSKDAAARASDCPRRTGHRLAHSRSAEGHVLLWCARGRP